MVWHVHVGEWVESGVAVTISGFADTISPSVLKRLIEGEEGAAE